MTTNDSVAKAVRGVMRYRRLDQLMVASAEYESACARFGKQEVDMEIDRQLAAEPRDQETTDA